MIHHIAAGILFAVIAAFVAVALTLFGFLYLFFFYFQPHDEPKRDERKRVRALLRAKGPAHSVILDPDPDTHGEVIQAAYPATARMERIGGGTV